MVLPITLSHNINVIIFTNIWMNFYFSILSTMLYIWSKIIISFAFIIKYNVITKDNITAFAYEHNFSAFKHIFYIYHRVCKQINRGGKTFVLFFT